MNEMLEKLGQNAKDAESVLRNLFTNDKNKTLEAVAKALVAHTDEILKANALDVRQESGHKILFHILLCGAPDQRPHRVPAESPLPACRPFRRPAP